MTNPPLKLISISGIAIESFTPEKHSIAEITKLLHLAYAPLAQMGFNYVAADQSAEVTESRLNAGVSYVAREGERIVGTVTYYPHVSDDSTHPELYKRSDAAHFGQFAVLPEAQRSGIGNLLMDCVEARAKGDNMSEIACDTAEGAAHLIAYYERRGYCPVGYQQWPHAVYRSVILAKKLTEG